MSRRKETLKELRAENARLKAEIKGEVDLGSYWKGCKVIENCNYTAKSNGKTYRAVKVLTPENKSLTLKNVRGGSLWIAKDF